MGLKVGIIGLPNVGKSTLFNAIMGRQQALTAPYPFATVQPNVGVVDVPDERLNQLHTALAADDRSDVTDTTPIVRSSITFVDIAGLVKGAAEGQGLGNQFLSHIRDVDVIVHVLRDFNDPDVPRHQDSKDPEHDAAIVQTELELKDLEINERTQREEKNKKEQKDKIESLADKPVIYAVNVGEDKLPTIVANPSTRPDYWSGLAQDGTKKPLFFCAKLEEEISKLPTNEQKEFMKMYGLKTSGLDRIISECYSLLGLISFFTAGKIEVRAWPARRGSSAPQAAGVIHSDFERLFIRAEVIDWQKLAQAGSWKNAKEKGLVRLEGREYIVADGDVCNFLIGK